MIISKLVTKVLARHAFAVATSGAGEEYLRCKECGGTTWAVTDYYSVKHYSGCEVGKAFAALRRKAKKNV